MHFTALSTFSSGYHEIPRRWGSESLSPLVQAFNNHSLQPGGETRLGGSEVFRIVDLEGAIFDEDGFGALG